MPFPQPVARRKSFLPYFLYFTKSRRKKSPQGGGEAAERQKDLIGLVQSFCLCALIRGLQNLESFFETGFNFVSGKFLFGWAESRFAKPRCSLQRERVYSFRLYEKNQKYPRGLRTSGLPGTIQSSVGNSFRDTSDGTCRTRFFAQNGDEKALNRCDVRALQREDLERTTKE